MYFLDFLKIFWYICEFVIILYICIIFFISYKVYNDRKELDICCCLVGSGESIYKNVCNILDEYV